VSWDYVTLGEVATVGAGNSAPQDEKLFVNGLHNFYRTSDVGRVRNGFISDATDKLNAEGIRGLKIHTKGTVLFPKSGASTFLNHRVMLEKEGYVSSHLATIKANNEKLDDRFLLYFLTTIDAKNLVQDSNYPSLKTSVIEKISTPLPPLATQQKIVAKLDAIFAEIDKATAAAEANTKNADLLVKGTITALINKFNKGCFVKFSDICKFVRGPFGGSLKKSIFVERGYAVYEQQHPINNQFDTFRYFITDEKFNEMRRFEVFSGDLLMSCSGVTLGKIAIVPKGAPKGIINQALLKITPKDSVRKEYLKLVMESDYFQSILWDVSGGAAQPNVPSVKVIKDFLIPLPTTDEQDDFIEIVSSVLSYELSSIYKIKAMSLMSLKRSILQEAFTDDLVR
jgi:type I restriction enzyme S subunit